MASFKQTLHLASSLLRLGFLTYIIRIYILIAIVFASNIKTISKPPGPIDQIESFLPPCFFAEQWSSNSITKSVASRPRI